MSGMDGASPTARLLVACPDRRGIVAATAAFVSSHGGNIVDLQQHTDHTDEAFFLRVEVEADGLDLRRDEPYLAYDQLNVPVVTRTTGDCHARFEVLLDQVYASLDLAQQCLDKVDTVGGPVNVRLPKVVKAPEGHTYAWTENPLGINGYYLVSRGEKTPWRMKLRTASYAK